MVLLSATLLAVACAGLTSAHAVSEGTPEHQLLPRYPVEVDDVHLHEIESRANSFKCPVFPGVTASQTCGDKDIFWDNVSYEGKTVTYYFAPNDKIISAASAANRKAVRDLLEDSIKYALTAYKNVAKGLKIYVGVVGLIENNSGLFGMANVGAKDNKVQYCGVLMKYPSSVSDPIIKLRTQKAMVHELYHCMQFGQNYIGMPKNGQGTRGKWWVEGTARWMDGVLYPPQKHQDLLDLGEFPEEYKWQKSLPEQTYEAALYYHYLNQAGISNAIINNWVTTKKARNTLAEDLADAANTPMLADNWHGFAEAFANNAINYTSKIAIHIDKPFPQPLTTVVPRLILGGMETWNYYRDSFTFNIGRFSFPKGTEHRLTFPSGKGFQCSYRQQGGPKAWLGHGDPSVTIKNTHTDGFGVDILCSCNAAVTCSGKLTVKRMANP